MGTPFPLTEKLKAAIAIKIALGCIVDFTGLYRLKKGLDCACGCPSSLNHRRAYFRVDCSLTNGCAHNWWCRWLDGLLCKHLLKFKYCCIKFESRLCVGRSKYSRLDRLHLFLFDWCKEDQFQLFGFAGKANLYACG